MAHEHSAYAVMCNCESVGKRFAGSKRRVVWKFVFHEDRSTVHEVVLKHSIMSGKREITMDGMMIHQSKKLNMKVDFDHPFQAPGHLLRVSIKEMLDRFVYSLFIDNVPFRHLPHNAQRKRIQQRSKQPRGVRGSSSRAKPKSRSSGGGGGGGDWDPFAEAAAASGGASGGKPKKTAKKKAVKKKKKKKPAASTDDWVSFDDPSSAAAPAGGDDLLGADDLMGAVKNEPAPHDPFSASALAGGGGASLDDLSSLYSATDAVANSGPQPANFLNQPTPQRPQQQQADAWGGLVDLNNNFHPPQPPAGATHRGSGSGVNAFGPATGTGMNAFGPATGTGMNAFGPGMGLGGAARSQNSSGRGLGGMPGAGAAPRARYGSGGSLGAVGLGANPGALPPQGFGGYNARPTRNQQVSGQQRKISTSSVPHAFEADPFARFT